MTVHQRAADSGPWRGRWRVWRIHSARGETGSRALTNHDSYPPAPICPSCPVQASWLTPPGGPAPGTWPRPGSGWRLRVCGRPSMACDLTVFGDRNNSAPISGNDRWVARSGRTRSSAAVSDDAPGTLGSRSSGQPGPERLGLADQGAQAGPALEHAHRSPASASWPRPGRRGRDGRGRVRSGPERRGEARVGQQRPHALSADKLLPRRRDIAPVPGHAGLHRVHEGIFAPGQAQHLACLDGRNPRPGPTGRGPSRSAPARPATPRACRVHRRPSGR